VLLPQDLHVSRSLRKVLRQDRFALAVDRQFEGVMRACAEDRADGPGTWIGADMLRAYTALHTQGHAHSIETYDRNGQLVGGLYGVAIGRVFFGESMFSRVSNASKVAMVALVDILLRGGYRLIDCQLESAHLNSLGAKNVPRLDFERMLDQTIAYDVKPGNWVLPDTCGALL
jgi:leucyl/phenylalanyl-tRNA--protein transferase